MENLIAFVISVLANVVSHFICRQLEDDDQHRSED